MKVKVLVLTLMVVLALIGAWWALPQTAESAPPPLLQEESEEPDRDQDQLDPFIPSEKLPADSAISFPVDI